MNMLAGLTITEVRDAFSFLLGRSCLDRIGAALLVSLQVLCWPLIDSKVALAQQEPPTFQAPVLWSPIAVMGDLFPSYVLATFGMRGGRPPLRGRFGDTLGVLGVRLTRPAGVSTIRVEVKANKYLDQSSEIAYLSESDIDVTEVEILPWIKYRTDALLRVREAEPLSITFELFADNVSRGEQTLHVFVRSVNDCPFLMSLNQRLFDLRFMFAAYVNEKHPSNDAIRQEALSLGVVNQFDGYQSGDAQQVYRQVFALWDVLQRHGVKYSDATVTARMLGPVWSQTVRLVGQSVKYGQANCVDGSVLFASLLRDIQIDPILVLVPGHMFVGFYLDSSHGNLAFLETTMLNTADLSGIPEEGKTSLGMLVKNAASKQSFDGALYAGRREYQQHSVGLSGLSDPQYGIISIAAARVLGVAPIPSLAE